MAEHDIPMDEILQALGGNRQPERTIPQQPRGYQLGQQVAGGQVAIVRPRPQPGMSETPPEPPRRRRTGVWLGITGVALVGSAAGIVWALNPGNGDRPTEEQPGTDGGDQIAAVTGSSEVTMPDVPSPTLESTLSPSAEPEESTSTEPSQEPTTEASEEPSPSDKPSDKPKKSPTKGAATPKPPIVNRTFFRTASVDLSGTISKDVVRVLSATPPTIVGVTEASSTQFENIPTRLGETFQTIPNKYGQNGREGIRFITYDSSKLRLIEQGSIDVPGTTATSIKDLNTSIPYGFFREIPTAEEKKQGVTGQYVLFVNLDLIDSERPWVVEKSKGKLSSDGKTKRDEQMRLVDNAIRAAYAGFTEKLSEPILVIMQGSLGAKQSGYDFASRSQDCFFTRDVAEEDLLFESSDAIEAGTDTCEYRAAKASDRRAYVNVNDAGVEKVIALTRRSPDGKVKVLLTDVERVIEQQSKKAGQ